jgi:hypothetical protein
MMADRGIVDALGVQNLNHGATHETPEIRFFWSAISMRLHLH